MKTPVNTPVKKKLLILSFSPIAGDARVLKQVEAFRDEFEVTTCGYGEAPDAVARHIQIPDDIAHNVLNDRYITAKRYKRAYWSLWSVAWVWKEMKRAKLKRGAWDVILANDVEAVPLALRLEPTRGVHADLHEYSPLLHEDWEGWTLKITPYLDWLCAHYVSQASSWTTVSKGLAREYERNFGFKAELVTNAAPFVDAEPQPVGDPIRIVHSGAALHDRRLGNIAQGVIQSTSGATLDFYLTPNQPAVIDELRELATKSDGRVRVLDPVPYAQLERTLRGYDVGIHMLPSNIFNNKWALPNKLFDYVQARLGVVVGPTPEMAEYVEQYALGTVLEGFEPEQLATVLDSLSREQVETWKNSVHSHARELSAETQVEIWAAAIRSLAAQEVSK